MKVSSPFRAGQTLGKYRLGRRLGAGGFAVVYRARDTVEGVDVALKVPLVQEGSAFDDLLKEVRINSRLEHPHILRVRNATFTDEGRLVIAYPLGPQTLDDRMRYRLASRTVLTIADQLLDATAYAHRRRVIHCDINPKNVILFDGPHAMLADFGIARLAPRTRQMSGSGTGTVGYIAPEQAMGKLSFRSDVFSLGLVIYRLFTGHLPTWPFRHPLPGIAKLRQKLRPEAVSLILRAVQVDDRKRFRNATQMHEQFSRLRKNALK